MIYQRADLCPVLDVLIHGNTTSIEKEIEEFLIGLFCTLELNKLYYTSKDLHEQLNVANIRRDISLYHISIYNRYNKN